MQSSLNRLMLYVRNVQAASVFYERHFGFMPTQEADDRVIELFPIRAFRPGFEAPNHAALSVHPAQLPSWYFDSQ